MQHQGRKKAIRTGITQWMRVIPFIGVSLVLMGMFVFYPLFRNIQISFSDYDVIGNSVNQYVGLRNYLQMFRNSKWQISLRNTLLYTLVTVPGQMFLGLLLACLIDRVSKGKNFFKVVTYLPVITSWVVASLIFKYLFTSGKAGLVNYVLLSLKVVSTPISWLQNEWTANLVLWLFGIWKGVGWVMVIYLAALQGVARDIYEAAEIDGVSKLQNFIYITVPMVRNTTMYLMTVLMIGAFGAYIHVMLITEGGPLGSTNELMNYLYDSAFSKFNYGYSAAQAVFMGIAIFALTFIQRVVQKENIN